MSQHRPSLITPPCSALPVPSMPDKRWNMHKAKWNHCFALTNTLAKNLLPPDPPNVDQVHQDFCDAISSAGKRSMPRNPRNNHVQCWDVEGDNLY